MLMSTFPCSPGLALSCVLTYGCRSVLVSAALTMLLGWYLHTTSRNKAV